ncbi:MAG: TAXI family TRAP transporter solute-binding subunit [Burkholderiales bacterium]|nr:TAXI family TRAP transporter solute-binding subunit [Burkholderiales bacterium]
MTSAAHVERQPGSMRRIARATIAMACTAGAWIGAQGVAGAADAVNMTIGSFNQQSSWYVYAVNLAEVLRPALPAGSVVDTPPIAGGLGNPRLVAEGKAQIAFGMAVVGTWAMEGTAAFKEPLKDLRSLVGDWDDYFLLPMLRGKGLPNDLAGVFKSVRPKARVMLLPKGSIGAFGGTQMLELVGAGEKALSAAGGGYEFAGFGAVKNRFAAGQADVFIHTVTRGHPGVTEIARSVDLTFLQPSKAVLAGMNKYGWTTATLPKDTFPGQDQALQLPGTNTTLFATTKLPDDMAYLVVKAICENTAKLQAAHKALAKFDCAKGVWRKEVNGMPLHAGAERYYRERGWLK